MRLPLHPAARGPAKPGTRCPSGFTLVEVTLAIGMASFALLVLFSLMPTGMASLQDTGRQIVETEIFNKISSELATPPLYSDYARTDALSLYQSSRFPAYSDMEGNELTVQTKAKAVFTVELGQPGWGEDSA